MKFDELGGYLVSGNLYRVEKIETPEIVPGNQKRGLNVPAEVSRHCRKCGGGRNWDRMSMSGNAIWETDFSQLTYRCRDCKNETLRVWVCFWIDKGFHIVKVGQYPRLEVILPKEFEDALGENASLYRKGMTSRHNGYGIGALSYFRRVVELTVDDMLGVLETAMVATESASAAIEHLRKARAGREFEDKVKLAAEVIPDHLKPGGVNPFADLHGLLSIGLHGLTDEECCDIVDLMDEPLKYVYTTLKAHTQGASQYRDAAQKINQAVGHFRGRAAKRIE
jgi:hypothetical protein